MRKLLSPRNIVIALAVLGVMLASAILVRIPLPVIVLPAEPVIYLGNIKLTNTFVATLIADLTVIVLAVLATRKMRDVPQGLQNLAEWFVEAFYNLSEDVAGKANVKKFFPIFMTILLFLLFCNWWGLIPGADSIGRLEPLEYAFQAAGVTTGYKKIEGPLGVALLSARAGSYTLSAEEQAKLKEEKAKKAEKAEAEHGAKKEDAHHESELGYYVIAPYLRPAATDLNLGLALALISVFWTQVVGVRALGGGYFRKFFLPSMTGMKLIDLIVGLLELVSEFAKIISFTFRLFGNIFAGMVLLFVMSFLIPFLVPLPFYMLELFVGFMQAFVFAILTLIFMTMATVSHEHGEEHH
ncbi:MAG: F0F1 ATP synthase subunit A [Caldilineales bacterium]|nr:F0F1 ATP synthase subunit A [Caldilineales bacterium]MDW8316864.1 F0F1 ATP synthase subunit A [Anaerolineae bacterium]